MPDHEEVARPLVSVIMPCYNAAPFLDEALTSILQQTYSNLEIIVINDGSTDSTPDMLQRYAGKDSRLVVINHVMNKGLVACLNSGVAIARGAYIARMDADDISVAGRIETELDHLLAHPDVDVVSCGFYYISPNGMQSPAVKPRGTYPLSLKFISLLATPMAHPSVLGKSSCFRNFAYDNHFIHSEDYDLFSRMAWSGIRLFNLVQPLYGIRLHQARVSNLFEAKQVDSHVRISLRNLTSRFSLQIPKQVHRILINRFTGPVQKKDILIAFDMMEKLMTMYLEQEQCSQEEKKEIKKFIHEQQADILIQAMKNSTMMNRVKLFSLLPTFLLLIVKPGLLQYLWIKFRMKL